LRRRWRSEKEGGKGREGGRERGVGLSLEEEGNSLELEEGGGERA